MEPLSTSHLMLDYEAVMESRTFLRSWSVSNWPDDHFRMEDNHEDLKNHNWEHQHQIAFTYTILTPDKKQCMGCVYINPNQRIEPVTEKETAILEQRPANVRFWTRNSIHNTSKENIILNDLISWFTEIWEMKDILFSCNKKVPSQITLFRTSGLMLWLELQQSSRHELLWCIK